jgi:hypothetical protein
MRRPRLLHHFKRSLTFKISVDVMSKGRKHGRHIVIEPSKKLLYGTLVVLTVLACLTLIEVLLIEETGQFNGDVFTAAVALLGAIGGIFFGVKT